ncbi:hypothetical protein PPEP_a2711 [Pseudoalteromonas peptidolytica F12-50-A1]|uniref:Uncharacterized protein n=1 Tax=Pseudoalteromonas peptidolytica F12-50-A1 TaxID=1315280 RepID=A0A8I0MSI5_9GAMM|nr:hypothetical protein [Pseudoalteromonas peptidolytica F12-50-A1]
MVNQTTQTSGLKISRSDITISFFLNKLNKPCSKEVAPCE